MCLRALGPQRTSLPHSSIRFTVGPVFYHAGTKSTTRSTYCNARFARLFARNVPAVGRCIMKVLTLKYCTVGSTLRDGVRGNTMSYSEKVVDHYENPRNVGSFDRDDSVGRHTGNGRRAGLRAM